MPSARRFEEILASGTVASRCVGVAGTDLRTDVELILVGASKGTRVLATGRHRAAKIARSKSFMETPCMERDCANVCVDPHPSH